jgi:hypothetical protein
MRITMSCMIKMYAELVRIECNRIILFEEKMLKTGKLDYNEEEDRKGIIDRCKRLISMCDSSNIDYSMLVDEGTYSFLLLKEKTCQLK